MKRSILIPTLGAASALFAAACSKPDNASGPGGVTVGEARALDEAAAMLDERRAPTGVAGTDAPQPAR
jgi:hypothetical protein